MEHLIGVPKNDEQQVIEIMGYPCGQPCHGLHLVTTVMLRFLGMAEGRIAKSNDRPNNLAALDARCELAFDIKSLSRTSARDQIPRQLANQTGSFRQG